MSVKIDPLTFFLTWKVGQYLKKGIFGVAIGYRVYISVFAVWFRPQYFTHGLLCIAKTGRWGLWEWGTCKPTCGYARTS